IGLFMVGLFHWKKTFRTFNLPVNVLRESYLGSFLMGTSFTLAFCPTLFVLFLFTFMSFDFLTSYRLFLPFVFGIGTSILYFLVIFLNWYFGASGAILRQGRKIGAIVQKAAGVLLIVIGFFDALIYW